MSTSKQIELSVILPVYNEGPAVELAARSILESLTSFDGTSELIIIDDASTDDTFAIVQAIADEYRGPHTLRIHRNALVARDRLAGLEKNSADHALVRLRGTDRRLEVSRRNLAILRKVITQL